MDTAHLTYLLAISLVLGLGSFAVAAEVWSRRGRGRPAGVLDLYAIVLSLAVIAGVTALGAGPVLGRWSPMVVGLGLVVGCAVGAGSRWSDRAIVRMLARRAAAEGRMPGGGLDGPPGRVSRTTPADGALLLGGGTRRRTPVQRRLPISTVDPAQFPLVTVGAVAVLEEAFYRGVLLQAALLPGGKLAQMCLVVLAVAAFSLAHVFFGWQHVLAKTPLGIGATASVLLVGSLVPAIVAHVWFNGWGWRDLASRRSVS